MFENHYQAFPQIAARNSIESRLFDVARQEKNIASRNADLLRLRAEVLSEEDRKSFEARIFMAEHRLAEEIQHLGRYRKRLEDAQAWLIDLGPQPQPFHFDVLNFADRYELVMVEQDFFTYTLSATFWAFYPATDIHQDGISFIDEFDLPEYSASVLDLDRTAGSPCDEGRALIQIVAKSFDAKMAIQRFIACHHPSRGDY